MSELLFKPKTELLFDTVVAERNRLLLLMNTEICTKLSFDMQEVTRCDSAGLTLLIDAKRVCLKRGADFVVMNLPTQLKELAEFCGVDYFLE